MFQFQINLISSTSWCIFLCPLLLSLCGNDEQQQRQIPNLYKFFQSSCWMMGKMMHLRYMHRIQNDTQNGTQMMQLQNDIGASFFWSSFWSYHRFGHHFEHHFRYHFRRRFDHHFKHHFERHFRHHFGNTVILIIILAPFYAFFRVTFLNISLTIILSIMFSIILRSEMPSFWASIWIYHQLGCRFDHHFGCHFRIASFLQPFPCNGRHIDGRAIATGLMVGQFVFIITAIPSCNYFDG